MTEQLTLSLYYDIEYMCYKNALISSCVQTAMSNTFGKNGIRSMEVN